MWDGVRNYAARNNLMAMKKGDLVFFYHSNEGLEIVGLAKVAREHYPDPTADDAGAATPDAAASRWVVVDLVPVKKLKKPVSLTQIKADPVLREMAIVRQSRLSVSPVTPTEFDRVMDLADEN